MPPLSGVRVLEFEALGPAPYACLLLAELALDPELADHVRIGLEGHVLLRGLLHPDVHLVDRVLLRRRHGVERVANVESLYGRDSAGGGVRNEYRECVLEFFQNQSRPCCGSRHPEVLRRSPETCE